MRIQEESSSSLMPRPPRAPKAAAGTESSSKLMLLSSIDIDTTANNNNNNNNCSSQGNGNGNGPSSCKSTGSGSTHFLDGFNVERCADVRSIPDPPTPQPRNHRHNHRHNHRRRSSPIVVGNRSSRHRLEDVTNNKNPPLSKRSRKSLCHVPAAGVEQRQEEEPQDNEPTNASAICLDDDVNDDVNDDDDDDLGHNKRRKKRQSMVLPKDLVEQHANTFASISHPKEQEEDEEDEALPQPSPNKKPKTTSTLFTGDWQSMKELQTMVRGYCASTGEQQPPQQPPQHAAAYFAKAIQDSTGYPLSKKKNTPSSSSNSSPRSKDRKAILQQVYPVIQEMDKRKVEETAFWERETQCRVEKSRSGKYRYRLIATHEKVSSKEYERRYMAVLERNYANRLEKAEQWKARLVETEEEEDLSLELGSLLDPMPQQQQQQQQRDDCISPLPIDSMEDDTMELCDLSASLDMGEATGFSFVDHDDDNNDNNKEETRTVSPEILEDQMIATAEQLERSETPTENEEREDVKPQSSSPPRSGVLLPDRKELERSEAPTENEEREDVKPQSSSPPRSGVLLPLPDREEESRDPDIARAERKLWGRIDEALEEYSREVMLILESKKQTSNQQGE